MNKIDGEGLSEVMKPPVTGKPPVTRKKRVTSVEPEPPKTTEPPQPAIELTTKMVRPLIDGITGLLERRFGQEFHYIESSKESIAEALIPVLEKHSTEMLTKYGAETALFLVVFGETYPRVVARNKRLAREQMAGESDPDKLEPFVPKPSPTSKPPAKKTATKKPVKRKTRKKTTRSKTSVGKPPFAKRKLDGTYAGKGE